MICFAAEREGWGSVCQELISYTGWFYYWLWCWKWRKAFYYVEVLKHREGAVAGAGGG
jgi:hypothetical protein